MSPMFLRTCADKKAQSFYLCELVSLPNLVVITIWEVKPVTMMTPS